MAEEQAAGAAQDDQVQQQFNYAAHVHERYLIRVTSDS